MLTILAYFGGKIGSKGHLGQKRRIFTHRFLWSCSYDNVILGIQSTLLGAFLKKILARSDTPYPHISPPEGWSLPKNFDFFKRKIFFSEGELKKKNLPKDA